MFKKSSFLILFLSLRLLNLPAQTHGKMRLKPRFSQTTTMGVAVPLGNFASKNKLGFHSGTVFQADLSPHFFARLTWDFFQLKYVQKTAIGNNAIDIFSNNNGNAFYLSSGFQKAIKQWKYYGFAGSGLTLLNDPKLEIERTNNVYYTHLSNQNARILSLNLGMGVGYNFSLKDQVKIETNLFYLPNVDKTFYLSLQFGYHLYLNNPKNTSFFDTKNRN